MRLALFVLTAALASGVAARSADAPVPPAPKDPGAPAAAVRRWQDMRFGLFIHWGPVSLTGQEIGWSRGAQTPIEEYDNLYQRFNPTRFDADEWAATAKAAGMKYVVLTTKHHDGFCLWDTKQTDYNIMRSPFARDVVKELSAAVRKAGLRFGTYYSTCDWHHPDFPRGSPGGKTQKPNPNLDRYTEYLRAQVTELVKNYGPLSTLWFDVPQDMGADRSIPTILMLRAMQPDILINNRAGGTPGDYDTPEQRVGGFNMDRPWETCMTICRQWAWKPDDTMKSLQQCLQTLIRTAGGDGNLLFNVGPMPDGRIEPRQIERLKEMGAWMQKHGDSIYATRGGPWKPGRWGASTRKGNTVYLHVFAFEGEELKLPAVPAKVQSARVLTGGKADFKQDETAITLSVPKAHQDPIDTLIALELDKPALELAPVGVGAGASLATGAKATASNVFQRNNHHAPTKAVDGDMETRWATDAGTRQAWIEIDLGSVQTFTRVAIHEWAGDDKRIRRFAFESKETKDAPQWKTVFEGTTVGADFTNAFPAVTARIVRLNILDATEGPTIDEIEILK